jgi:hypothetical protein
MVYHRLATIFAILLSI